MIIFEKILITCIYIFVIIYFSIITTPNWKTISIFALYVFVSTYLFISCGYNYSFFKCHSTNFLKFSHIIIYTIICTICYIFIHYFYWNYKSYRLLLLCLPFFYWGNLAAHDYYFACKSDQIYRDIMRIRINI